MLVKDGDGTFIVFHMEGQGGTTAGTRQKCIRTKNIHVRREQCCKQPAKFRGTLWKFNDEQITYRVWDFVLSEDVLNGLWIANDDPDDGGVRRRLHAGGDNVNVVVV